MEGRVIEEERKKATFLLPRRDKREQPLLLIAFSEWWWDCGMRSRESQRRLVRSRFLFLTGSFGL